MTLTNSANLILPSGVSITTAANDVLCFRCLAAGQWIMTAGSRASATLASPSFTGTALYNGNEIGFRGLPQTVTNAAYTFVTGDRGQCRVKTQSAAYTYTLPAATFAAGDVLTVMNSSLSGNITIAGSGVTL